MSAFNSMAGGMGPELQEAMMRRQQGMGGAASAQQSPGSAGFDPNMQAPQPPQGSAPMPTINMAPPPGTSMEGSGLPQPPMSRENPDTKIILGAMKERLSHINKMESMGI